MKGIFERVLSCCLLTLYVFCGANAVPSKISIRPQFTQVLLSSSEPLFKENALLHPWHAYILLFVKEGFSSWYCWAAFSLVAKQRFLLIRYSLSNMFGRCIWLL